MVLAGWTTIQPSTPPRPLVANITDLGRGAGAARAGVGVLILVFTDAAAMVSNKSVRSALLVVA